MDYPESNFVYVIWDGSPGLPEHVARGRLVVVSGYRVRPCGGGAESSTTFASREEAEAYRSKILDDVNGQVYEIFPVDEGGNLL